MKHFSLAAASRWFDPSMSLVLLRFLPDQWREEKREKHLERNPEGINEPRDIQGDQTGHGWTGRTRVSFLNDDQIQVEGTGAVRGKCSCGSAVQAEIWAKTPRLY